MLRPWMCCCLFVSSLLVNSALGEPLFIAFGDYGEDRSEFRHTVSRLKQLPRPKFVALLGDLLYPKGVNSTEESQFRLFHAFSDISDQFLVSLGNHDYGTAKSVPALLEYAKIDSRWILPSRYYLRRIPVKGGLDVCAITLDTHVFDSTQLSWFKHTLKECESHFIVVLTHYPLLSVGIYANSRSVEKLRDQLLPLLKKYRVHAYISGHEHQMQAFELDRIHFLISGATAQLNRNKGMDETGKWANEVRYANDKTAGVLVVDVDTSGGDGCASLVYRFVKSKDGSVLYSNRIYLDRDVAGEPAAEIITEKVEAEPQSESHGVSRPKVKRNEKHQSVELCNHTVPQFQDNDSKSSAVRYVSSAITGIGVVCAVNFI